MRQEAVRWAPDGGAESEPEMKLAASTAYTYDAYGNPTSQTDPLSRQTQYTYGALGRQATITQPLPSGAGAASDTTTNN